MDTYVPTNIYIYIMEISYLVYTIYVLFYPLLYFNILNLKIIISLPM